MEPVPHSTHVPPHVPCAASRLCRFGPREVPGGRAFSSVATLACDVRYAPFSSRPWRSRTPESLDAEREASLGLTQALAPCIVLARYPKALIDVVVTVLEADGGEDAAALLAASLALADAGIEMLDVPVAATVASVGRAVAASGGGGRLVVDPDASELHASSFSCLVVLLPRIGTIVRAVHSGEAAPADFVRCTSLAMDACLAVFSVAREALAASVRRRGAGPTAAASIGRAPAAAAAAIAGS